MRWLDDGGGDWMRGFGMEFMGWDGWAYVYLGCVGLGRMYIM